MRDDDESLPVPGFRSWRLLRIASRGDVEITERSMMRRGQLVLSDAAAGALADVLVSDLGGAVAEDPGSLTGLGFQRWTFDVERPVVDVVQQLRDVLGADADDPAFVVAPNYVLTGEPKYAGGPGGTPSPAADRWEPSSVARRPDPDIAVLDTGVPVTLASLHRLLAGAVRRDADDRDELYRPGSNGELLSEAGHGTFIAGLVVRMSPDLVVDVGEVLDPEGIGDDASVTQELLETTAPVVNLSLGGYTEDDAPPPLLTAAIGRLLADRGRVVVAAAGNNASERPFWPAALATEHDDVVSVAACDVESDGTIVPAGFSNRGDWVVASSYGVGIVSTYVTGTYPGPRGPADFAGNPFAAWDGTSFAAPLLAAEIAGQVRATGDSAADVWAAMRAGLGSAPTGFGSWYEPPTDPRRF